jgi:hypothetical protein
VVAEQSAGHAYNQTDSIHKGSYLQLNASGTRVQKLYLQVSIYSSLHITVGKGRQTGFKGYNGTKPTLRKSMPLVFKKIYAHDNTQLLSQFDRSMTTTEPHTSVSSFFIQ